MAFEVAVSNIDGTGFETINYYPHEHVARSEAVEFDRKYGPGSSRLTRLTWVGADGRDCHADPIKRDRLAVVDPADPELAEYLRLHDRFRGLHLPKPSNGRPS